MVPLVRMEYLSSGCRSPPDNDLQVAICLYQRVPTGIGCEPVYASDQHRLEHQHHFDLPVIQSYDAASLDGGACLRGVQNADQQREPPPLLRGHHLPEILRGQFAIPFYFGGTSVLIVVSVTMDTIQQVQSHLLAHQYESLIQKSQLRGKSRSKRRRGAARK